MISASASPDIPRAIRSASIAPAIFEHLKRKVDNGGCLVITQLFFDNDDFYRFRDAATAMGIKVPIVAGIMPIAECRRRSSGSSRCAARRFRTPAAELET